MQDRLMHELSFCQSLQQDFLEQTSIIAELQEQLILADVASRPMASAVGQVKSPRPEATGFGHLHGLKRGQRANRVAQTTRVRSVPPIRHFGYKAVMQPQKCPPLHLRLAQENRANVTPSFSERTFPMSPGAVLSPTLSSRSTVAHSQNNSRRSSKEHCCGQQQQLQCLKGQCPGRWTGHRPLHTAPSSTQYVDCARSDVNPGNTVF